MTRFYQVKLFWWVDSFGITPDALNAFFDLRLWRGMPERDCCREAIRSRSGGREPPPREAMRSAVAKALKETDTIVGEIFERYNRPPGRND